MVKRYAAIAALLISGCSQDAYVIGALCPAAGACPSDGGTAGAAGGGAQPLGSFELDLTGSGPERLPEQLLRAEASQFFVASDATPDAWPARRGDAWQIAEPTALELAQPAPFADPGSALRCSGQAAFTVNSDWSSTSAGAFALEAVFRGEPGAVLLSQRDGDSGLELSLDALGRLNLRLGSEDSQVVASSGDLVADAWHHCLALVDTIEGEAQLICNAHAGDAALLPAGFRVAALSAPAMLGSSKPARVTWAQLARFESSGWGPRGAWLDQARERFARLVGTYANGAREPLPFAEVRDSGAYLDMSPSDAPKQRRLHPVGAHWPRIVCRPTASAVRTCGLLVEAASSQPIAAGAFSLDQWQPSALTLASERAPGPTGSPSLFGLAPTSSEEPHALELEVPFGEGPAVLSFFARSGSRRLVRAEVVGVASATFDLEAMSVVEETGTLVSAVEDWGDGLRRLSYSFDVTAGPGRLRLALLANDGADTFAGDGAIAAHLGDAELRFRSYSTQLPTFGAIQRADQLIYPAGNGNLAGGPYFDFSAEIWLPDAPLLADAAIVNASFADRFDQQINLFVSPAQGAIQFWGLQGGVAAWQFSSARGVNDGRVHQVVATVDKDGASLSVDGERTTSPAASYDTSALDRVQIGASVNSSGPLTGIVRRVLIATPHE